MLANPPYVRQEKIIHFKDRLKRKYNLFNSTSDLYVYFYELSFNLLKEKGTSVFITSNKWMRAKYGKLLRIFFKNEVCLSEIMNFSEMKVFENAITNTNITVFSKNKSKNESINYTEFSKDQSSDDLNKFYNKNSIPIIKNKLDLENFYFLDKKNEDLKYKIENKCEPLVNFNYKIYKGIYTGFNEAFIINNKTKNDIINKSNKTLKFIKPILRGRDITKYGYEDKKLWMITIPSGWTNKQCRPNEAEKFMRQNYSEILDHLEHIDKSILVKKGKGLKKRHDMGDYWWELRDCDYYNFFKEKK